MDAFNQPSIEDHVTQPDDAQLHRTTLHIARPGELGPCRFWVSFYNQGKKDAKEASHLATPEEKLLYGGTKGFAESQPLALTDAKIGVRNCILFMPASGYKHTQECCAYIINVIRGWDPERVGFYVAPNLFKKIDSQRILFHLVQEVIKDVLVKDIYLFTGHHGLNELLSVTSEIRKSLDRPIDIFH